MLQCWWRGDTPLGAVLLSVIMAGLRIAYDGGGGWKKMLLEGFLCGCLTLTFASALECFDSLNSLNLYCQCGRVPGLNWEPKHRMSSLKQVEEALYELIAIHGECCTLQLPVDVQAEVFPEMLHTWTERRLQRLSAGCAGRNGCWSITGGCGRTSWGRPSQT